METIDRPIPPEAPPAHAGDTGDEPIERVPLYRRKQILVPVLVILIAAVAGVYWYLGRLGYVATDDALVDGDKLTVSAKMLGRIVRLPWDEGDTVANGQLLVQLDSVDIVARMHRAEATLRLANESVNLARVALEKAQDDFTRAEGQFKDAVIPKEQYDHARRALESAQAEWDIAKTKIGTSEAEVRVLETELRNVSVYSSLDGIVGKRWVLAGDVVQPGQPILTVFDLGHVWVTAYLEETKLASIRLGDSAEISVDAYPDLAFAGEVVQIGSNTASEFALIPPSNASGNFTKVTQRVPVRLSVRETPAPGDAGTPRPARLLPGMSVEIRIRVKR